MDYKYPFDHATSTLPISVLEKFKSPIFFETGTNTGKCVEMAISLKFEKIISIDLCKNYIEICKKKFENNKNVELYCGDSSKILFDLIKGLNDRITFWLDGHDFHAIPLLQEIRQIGQHHIKNHIIMIDDVRMMDTADWDFLKQEDVKKEILKVNDKYVFSYFDTMMGKNDVLVATVK